MNLVFITNIWGQTIIYVPDDYMTIQDAVDAAFDGHLIVVAPGKYSENVLINKSLVLKGPNEDKIGFDSSRINEAAIEGTIYIEASNVTLKGLKIDGTNSPQNTILEMYGILVGYTNSQSNILIENNIIKSWAKGISLAASNHMFPWNENIIIQGNLIEDNGTAVGSTENVNSLIFMNNYLDGNSNGIRIGTGINNAKIIGNFFHNTINKEIY